MGSVDLSSIDGSIERDQGIDQTAFLLCRKGRHLTRSGAMTVASDVKRGLIDAFRETNSVKVGRRKTEISVKGV